MTIVYAAAIAAYAGCGAYMVMSRNLVRIILGLALMTNGAILMIFVAGRVGAMDPPVIPAGEGFLASSAANALPQALVLTAIVIGFALTAFTMILALAAFRERGSLNTTALPAEDPAPASQTRGSGAT